MTKHTVARFSELKEGQCKLVQVQNAEIALFFIEGEYRAYRNVCPHAGAPLCSQGESRFFGLLPGKAEYERGAASSTVRCPLHGWEFDLRTGAFVRNPACTLAAYRVEVADGAVSVWV